MKSGPAIGRGGVCGRAPVFFLYFFGMIHINWGKICMTIYAVLYLLGIDENRSCESYVN